MAELVPMRKAYGEALVALGRSNEDVVALSADVANSDHSYMFAEAFPDRFFNVGIAEQSLVDVAVGFANTGKIPFANTFAFLFATRALEMVRTHLCYGKSNVKLMGGYAGLSDSFDGPTHHSYTDLAIMRSLPNMTIVVPAEPTAMNTFLEQIAALNGPVFCRLNRNAVPSLFDSTYKPVLGKAHTAREGSDLTIIACGIMVSRALDAAERLDKEGLSARVLNMHTIKPLDEDAVIDAAQSTGAVVTAEEHSVIGGLGGAVAEVIGDRHPVPVKRVGVDDRFTETGPYDKLLDTYGMSVDDIVRQGKAAVDAKVR
ncbi:MAG: transketolase family protein [Spirochaetota bacterium]